MWFQGKDVDSVEFKARLKARGWTQKRFHQETGTPMRTVEDWARGINRIPPVVGAYFDALDETDVAKAEVDHLRSRIRSLGGKV